MFGGASKAFHSSFPSKLYNKSKKLILANKEHNRNFSYTLNLDCSCYLTINLKNYSFTNCV